MDASDVKGVHYRKGENAWEAEWRQEEDGCVGSDWNKRVTRRFKVADLGYAEAKRRAEAARLEVDARRAPVQSFPSAGVHGDRSHGARSGLTNALPPPAPLVHMMHQPETKRRRSTPADPDLDPDTSTESSSDSWNEPPRSAKPRQRHAGTDRQQTTPANLDQPLSTVNTKRSTVNTKRSIVNTKRSTVNTKRSRSPEPEPEDHPLSAVTGVTWSKASKAWLAKWTNPITGTHAALVLIWCCSGVALVLLWCCSAGALVLLGCCSGVALVLLWCCSNGVALVLVVSGHPEVYLADHPLLFVAS
jgi:hypothetical protein